jgi:gliding motility-associated-like protein
VLITKLSLLIYMKLFTPFFIFIILHFSIPLVAQIFPNPATLSTGQGTNGTNDPIWQVSNWFNVWPTNTMLQTYNPAFISNNCAPGSWIDPGSLPTPLNNGNWISSSGMPCDGISNAYVAFRLTLNLPADCNGNSLAVPGNYILSFDGYVDNTLVDVFINGVSENIPGLPGGSFTAGSQINIVLDGPWAAGTNYVDFVVNNNVGGGGNLASTGDGDPYGLFLVANSTFGSTNDSDGDGVADLFDECPCTPGNNAFGCYDSDLHNCDFDAIRQAFTNAGCTEIPSCADDCSAYFLNPTPLSGTDAQAFAQTLGSNLISIQSAAENQCIIDALNNMGQNGVIWIGFTDEGQEGNFYWYDQSPITYTNWAPGEPNNSGGNENYVQIYPNGQWNDLAFNGSAVSVIEVNLCPVVNAGTDVSICQGETTNLTATNTLFGSHPYTYTWSDGTVGQTLNVSPTDTTQFTITTIDRYNCTTTDDVTVFVSTTPTVASSFTIDCATYIANFTDESTLSDNSSSITQWSWNFGDGNTSTQQNPTHHYLNFGNFNASLTVTTAANCSNTQTFLVNAPPPSLIKITDNNPLCDPNALIWANWTNVTGTTAQGTISSTINMNITHSVGGMSTTPEMFNGGIFPTQYGVPINNTALRNDLAGQFNFCFNVPVSNPQIAFSSIGNGGNPVQINTSVPYDIIWTGVDMQYPTNQTMIGSEGFTIITFPGTHTCITFDYLQNESYCNIAFGIQDTNCQVMPRICPGESVTLTASGGTEYSWSPANGLNTTTGATVIATPLVTTTYYAMDANGSDCVLTDSVTITVHPVANVNFTQNDVCDQSSMNFTNTSTLSLGTMTNFLWDFGDATGTTTIENPNYTYAMAGDYNVLLTVTTNEGCESSTTTSVVVHPLPLVNFTIDNACPGSTVNLTNTSTIASGANQHFTWQFGDSSPIQNTEDAAHSYTTAGTYTITLTVISTENCSQNTSQDVTLFPVPQVSFSQSNVCEGNAMNFVSNATITTGTITQVDWVFGDGIGTSSLSTPSYTYDTEGEYTVTLIAESNEGCIDSISANVTVFPLPEPSFTQNNVCLGEVMDFTNTSAISSGSLIGFNWNFGVPLATSTSESPSYSYLTAGSFNVILVATSNEGCVFSISQPVLVSALPQAGFTVANVCNQTAAFMQNTATGPVATTQWDYTSDGIIDFTGTNASFTYPSAGTYSITQTVTSNVGCGSSTTQNITVHPLPVVNISGQNVCEGNSVTFTNVSGISSGNITGFIWDFGNGSSSTEPTPIHNYTFQGVFNVSATATSNNGCTATGITQVQIFPIPQAQFITSNICEDETADFTSISSVSNQFTNNIISSTVWDFGVAPAVGASGVFSNHTYPTPGEYSVTIAVTTNNGCSNTNSGTIIIHPRPEINFISLNNEGCTNLCVNFTNTSSIASGAIEQWVWNFGNGNASTSANAAECYLNETNNNLLFTVSLTGISDEGCSQTTTQSNFVTVFPTPIAIFEADKYVSTMYQTTFSFTNLSINADYNTWHFDALDSSSLQSPSYIFPTGDSGIYEICLLATSINGCMDENCQFIEITAVPNIYIPSAFTPDNDGLNDYFTPIITGVLVREFIFQIFDRWGALIFETNSPSSVFWDGTYLGEAVQLDTYIWKLSALNKYDLSEIKQIGHVTVIR